MAIAKIKKRSGLVVDFEPTKISSAIGRAMAAVSGDFALELEKVSGLSAEVLEELSGTYLQGGTPTVEEVQDLVEKVLMKSGYYEVARAYILYRERHRELRESRQKEVAAKIEEKRLYVTNRQGRLEVFEEEKIQRYLLRLSHDLPGIQRENILAQIKAGIYEGIKTFEIAKLSVLATKAFIELDPIYSRLTSRLFLSALYKEVINQKFPASELSDYYRKAFVDNLQSLVEQGKLSSELLEFDLELLARCLEPGRDELFNYRGLQTLYDRYFLSQEDASGPRRLETPQAFWMRVAMGLSLREKQKERWAIEFYQVLSSLRFVSSTPTLLHSGTNHPQLSSCYLNTVEDDLKHIFKVIGDNAQLSKWSGGLGTDWSNLRAAGALIKGTGVSSQGVIPFLKVANDTTVAINRSGKRHGAACAYLETWHLDVEEFLDLRRNTGDERRRTHDMNTANWVPDLFMKRVEADGVWTLFSPEEVSDLHHLYGKKFELRYEEYEKKAAAGEIKLWKRLPARELWRKMITRLFETGHPWITFKDACNLRSPQDHVGVVHSSNLCTEITLNTTAEETAVCNLGSVNLARHVVSGELQESLLKETVTTAMRMLDNVIDVGFYPTTEARDSNLKHRPVGLGVMGYQDALFLLGVNFDSPAAVECADKSMETVAFYAFLSSSSLAAEKGRYPSFNGSKWQRGILPLDTLDLLEKERGVKVETDRQSRLDWQKVRRAIAKNGMRNSNCLAIAPTATISNISGCFPSIEPIYKNLYVKSNMSGEFTVDNPYLVADLKKLNLWNSEILEKIKARDGSLLGIAEIPDFLKEKYKTAFEIDYRWLLLQAAARGKWIDQSQSLNIFTATTSGKKIAEVYLEAWRLGLKTTYYLRTLGASGVEKSTVGIGSAFQENLESQENQVLVAEPASESLTQMVNVEVATRRTSSVSIATDLATRPELSAEPSLEEELGTLRACLIDDPECEACQ